MPIYEFYCHDCNTIFNFFSRKINTSKRPACPKCGKARLEKQVSVFSTASGGEARGDSGEDLPIDEKKMESAMTALAAEAERVNENDPRQAANLMRKFSRMTGIEFGDGMEQALNRLEAGEDPSSVEKDMESLMEGKEPFALPGQKAQPGRRLPPSRDTKLYEM